MVRAGNGRFSTPRPIRVHDMQIFFSFKIEETRTLTTLVEQKLSL